MERAGVENGAGRELAGQARRARVVIVTYYWPPSGGAGVQRWLKMAKCLAAGGAVEPIIFTPSNPDPPLRDGSLLADVPEGLRVVTYSGVEPGRALRRVLRRERGGLETTSAAKAGRGGLAGWVARWVRGNLFIPDARCFSVRRGARSLRRWIERNGADAIITTGPPHSMHLIGLRVQRACRVRWIADFRDPWVDFPYLHYLPLTGDARRRHALLERRVVTSADRVLVVSPTMQRNFARAYGRAIDLVYNGYDRDDFVGLPPHVPSRPFTLLHCGEMKDDQSPRALWDALAELRGEGSITLGALRVLLIGRVAGGVLAEVETAGAGPFVSALPPVAHTELPSMLREASALLLSINRVPGAEGIITGKRFEYLAAERPILAFGPPGGDTAALIGSLDAGKLFSHDDTRAVKQTLLAWMAAEGAGALRGSNGGRARFSRQEQAEAVVRIVEEECGRAR